MFTLSPVASLRGSILGMSPSDLLRRSPGTEKAILLLAEGVKDPGIIARLSAPSLDLFHDPRLGNFDRYLEATRQMIADPYPLSQIHRFIV